MDLNDATLTIWGEAAAHPGLAALARAAFEQQITSTARPRVTDDRDPPAAA